VKTVTDDSNTRARIDTDLNLHAFFREALGLALTERNVATSAPTEHYLVALLVDFVQPDELAHEALERPIPFLLSEAMNTVGRERFDRLRALGDAVLFTSGFFKDHYETRGLRLQYVSSLGARAYDGAASMLRTTDRSNGPRAPELFEELADKFTAFVHVLGNVADGFFARSAQSGDSGTLRVYERWLHTGSRQLAAALANRGLMPSRGPGGVH